MWERNVLVNPIPEYFWIALVTIASLYLVYRVAQFSFDVNPWRGRLKLIQNPEDFKQSPWRKLKIVQIPEDFKQSPWRKLKIVQIPE
ncbi:MAG: hypothetical protein ACXAE3_11535 [Candidatus Kariarchaeaceae archaeon]|jgi:hypothetical protein